jgi:hypothetical protein
MEEETKQYEHPSLTMTNNDASIADEQPRADLQMLNTPLVTQS